MRFKHTANRIKKLLLISSLCLVLCSAVFMGASYAWFTDEEMAVNRVLVGKLNIDLLMDKTKDGAYVSIDGGKGDIFSEATGNGTRWEPGKTEIVYLAVENKGDVELDYYFKLRIADLGLADSLEYAIIDDAKAGDLAQATTWEELLAWQETAVTTGDLKTLMDTAQDDISVSIVDPETGAEVAKNAKLISLADGDNPNGRLDEGELDYFALAVHMKEDAGNDYQNKGIVFDVAVLGQQVYGYTGTGPADADWLKN